MPVMITVGRKVAAVNTSMCDVWGYKRENIIGKPTCIFYTRKEDYNNVGLLLQCHKEFTYKAPLRRGDGRIVTANIKVTKNEEENYVTIYFDKILEES